MKNNKLVFLVLCMMMCMVLFGCKEADSTYISAETQTEEDTVAEETETEETKPSGTVFVYVCGAVIKPGVYELQAGCRITDAIDAAGGFLDDAATDYWNQAEQVVDGQMIYVPTIEEAKERNDSAGASGESEGESVSDGRININTATKEELITLSGIGETRAQSIINYRTEHGNFNSVEELTLVSGIGDALLSKIREYITVD